MLLAIDVGNTNVTFGLFSSSDCVRKWDGNFGSAPVPLAQWRLSSDKAATVDEYAVKILALLAHSEINPAEIQSVIISNVVPVMGFTFRQISKKYFGAEPWTVGENCAVPMTVLCDHPSEVGADRLVNAFAAYHQMQNEAQNGTQNATQNKLQNNPQSKPQNASIVVDFGTATTFDCISARGEYLGGVIVPGPLLSAEALARRTAKLPNVSWDKPKHLIGKNTVESIQSGLYYGYLSLIDGLIDRILVELPAAKILATGGLAHYLSKDSRHIQPSNVFPDLTLQGLFLLYQKTVVK